MGASRGLGRAIALALAGEGIRVACVARNPEALRASKKFDSWVRGRTPLNRWGKPEDVIGAVLYLAAYSSDYVTGTVLQVDGGWLASA